tara:strand:+ start:200 stop:508 length:309 start_codon:yes stop_codon:yes gene_type:complete
VEIKNKKSFNQLIKSLTEEIIEEEDLTEITTTAAAPGYMTPMAFTGGGPSREKKKKRKKNTHREKIGESIDEKDLVKIKKLIKVVVGDIIRDIWLKRAAWNK